MTVYHLIHAYIDFASTSLFRILQVLIIREKLAELYESEQQWSKAAQMLSGINLDSSMRYESKLHFFFFGWWGGGVVLFSILRMDSRVYQYICFCDSE